MTYCPRTKAIEPSDEILASELKERILARQPLIFVDSGDYEQFDRILAKVAASRHVDVRAIYEYVPGIGTLSFEDKTAPIPSADEERDPHGVDSFHHFLFGRAYEDNTVLVIRGGTQVFECAGAPSPAIEWVRMIVGNSLNDRRLAQVKNPCWEAGDDDGDRLERGRFLTLIVVGSDIVIPRALIPYSARLKIRKLDQRQIRKVVEDEIALIEKRRNQPLCFGVDFSDRYDTEKIAAKREQTVRDMLPRLRGFSEMEIRQLLRFASNGQDFNSDSERKIANAKREMVERTGYLKLVDVAPLGKEPGAAAFAGLESLRAYFERTRKLAALPPETLRGFNGDGTKGVLLVGMPGCGKSLAAKAAGQILGWPVIGLDVGRLLGKFVGESERNLRLALDIAERAAPCVLWIDELEKAFAGLNASDGTALRLFGSFLTWLQEKQSLVYVVATANNVDKIPDEFKRKGRFDEIFRILLPDRKEREQIFKFHLKRLLGASELSDILRDVGDESKLERACGELAKLATGDPKDQGRGFSGSDIASVVSASVGDALVEGGKPGTTTWSEVKAALEKNIRRMKEKHLTQRDLMLARRCIGQDGKPTNAYALAKDCLMKGGYRSASKE